MRRHNGKSDVLAFILLNSVNRGIRVGLTSFKMARCVQVLEIRLADNSVKAVISIKGYKICDSLYSGLHHYMNIGEYNQWY